MSELTDTIVAGWREFAGHSGGVLVHSGTSYDIARAFSLGATRDMLLAGYDPGEVDAVALLLVDDISGPGPEVNDAVTLDGADYQVKGPIDKNPVYWQIPLRKL